MVAPSPAPPYVGGTPKRLRNIARRCSEVSAACKGARPNHIGAAIARHKRAGRIEERDGKLYATQSIETVQPAVV